MEGMAMASPAEILPLIEQIYGAAEQPQSWERVLQTLCGLTGSAAAGLFVQDLRDHSGRLLVNAGGDPDYVRRYHEHYAAINPWFRFAGSIAAGEVRVGYAERDFGDSEYYRDFWWPQRFGDTLTAYAYSRTAELGGVVVTRSAGDAPFGDEQVGLFKLVLAHLRRGLELQVRVQELGAQHEALLHILDRQPQGAVLLDERRRVLRISRSARAILERGDALSVREGRLRVAGRTQALHFDELLHAAIASGLGAGPGVSSVMRLTSGQRALALLVASIPGRGQMLGGRAPAAVVFMCEEGVAPALAPQLLAELFDLTPAEGRVGAELAAGFTPEAIARRSCVSLNTTRTHLKRLFLKTGTARQAELVALLAGSVVGLAGPSPDRTRDTEG